MLDLLLQDRELTGRRIVAGLAGGHRRYRHKRLAAIHIEFLVGDADDNANIARYGRGRGIPQKVAGAERRDGHAGQLDVARLG